MRAYANDNNFRDDNRLLTEEGVMSIVRRLERMKEGDGLLAVRVQSWWIGSVRWGRNRVSMSADQRDCNITIVRAKDDGQGGVTINQSDDESLKIALRACERSMNIKSFLSPLLPESDGLIYERIWLPFPDTAIWSQSTLDATPEDRSFTARSVGEIAEDEALLSAGTISMRVYEEMDVDPGIYKNPDYILVDPTPRGSGGQREARRVGYQRHCESECSITVRHPKGVGSGWAGLSSFDWSAIDPQSLSKIALEKCRKSLNPVAIEPGRYTVILEPPAVSSLVDRMMSQINKRISQQTRNPGPFSLDVDPALGMRMTKLGLKVIDERITISHDPMDAVLGVIPELALTPVTWIENGVLKSLSYGRGYGLSNLSDGLLNENMPNAIPRTAYRMSGGQTTIEEMIETMDRGVLVSRFSQVQGVPGTNESILTTGLTRDGLWLIEKGTISKAVKNMRFTDSPLFVLNQVEQLGVPVPVFKPSPRSLSPCVVPAIKSKDFAFTATIDAV